MNRRPLSIAPLLLAALLTLALGCATPGSAVHFYFVQITDTHLGADDNLARTGRAVAAINRLPMKIEFVAHTGDIMDETIEQPGLVAQGQAVFHKLNVPIHFLPGNNDILAEQPGPTTQAYQKAFGALSSRAETHGVVLLFFNSEPLRNPEEAAAPNPLDWLERELRAAHGKPVIIFTHAPPCADFYNNHFYKSWPDAPRARFENLIVKYDVKAVIAGHFHRDELHWLNHKIPLYVCPPVAGKYGRQATYRIYEYQSGRLSYSTQYLE